MFTTLVMLFAAGLGSEEVGMKFIASGAYTKASNPAKNPTILVTLSEKVLPIKKAPEGLVSPRYGAVKIGDQSWTVIVEEPEGEPSKLHVDTNADGDLTNDPEPKWTIETNNGSTRYVGEAQLDLGDGNRGTLLLIGSDPSSLRLRFEASDPRLAALKNRLLCRQDYGYEITTKLDGHEFTSYLCGKPNDATSLWIDRDGNGRRSRMQEFIYVGKPFNFTGTTYVLKFNGGKFGLDKADATLPIMPLPPDLSIGKQAPPFEMLAMNGDRIDFPKTYAGKLVMLDFWATWCGPCVAELPNVKQAYEAWHNKGFEVLGISFDDKGMAQQVEAFTKEKGLPWPQIYEGNRWDTTLGGLYDVNAIPFALLVDGDSGEILGTSAELRGPGLRDFIGNALTNKNKPRE